MKTKNFFVLLLILMLSAPMAFSSNAEATAPKVENKAAAEELSSMKTRVEEIRDMDKSNMTVKERTEKRVERNQRKHQQKRRLYLYWYRYALTDYFVDHPALIVF
ncbi:MAG: hypothetical protein NTY32_07925 [Bacteroidia bacterium]|nr:hypothetical protein [Bacteroidia bacterium]